MIVARSPYIIAGQRTAAYCAGRRRRSLRAAEQATGIAAAAVRSRLHRARRAGLPETDIAIDRRRAGARRAARSKARLPDPRNPAAPLLNAAEFAAAAGLPKATVITRLARIRLSGCDPVAMPRPELLEALLLWRDRRVAIRLKLPSGRVLRGGVRETVRAVLSTRQMEKQRREHLGASAIRARLIMRRISGWPDRLSESGMMWAFGFRPEAAPAVRAKQGSRGR